MLSRRSRFSSRCQSVLSILPFVGGAIACACLINFGTRDSISLRVMPDWSVPLTAGMAGIFALVIITGLVKRNGFRSTVTLPIPVQRTIHLSGLATMLGLMVVSLLNMSVWNDLVSKHMPNRLVGMTSVYTQKVFFGDYAALHLVWSLYENAQACNDKADMRYYKDQAEFLCQSTPSLQYSSEHRANGDIMHQFKNGTMGTLRGAAFVHEDGSSVYFGTNGWIQFMEGLEEFQPIDVGEPIDTINVLERRDNTIEYRLNGAIEPQVTINTKHRTLKVSHLKTGD